MEKAFEELQIKDDFMFSVIISVAMNMLQDGDLPLEKIAKYSGFTLLSLMIGEKEKCGYAAGYRDGNLKD